MLELTPAKLAPVGVNGHSCFPALPHCPVARRHPCQAMSTMASTMPPHTAGGTPCVPCLAVDKKVLAPSPTHLLHSSEPLLRQALISPPLFQTEIPILHFLTTSTHHRRGFARPAGLTALRQPPTTDSNTTTNHPALPSSPSQETENFSSAAHDGVDPLDRGHRGLGYRHPPCGRRRRDPPHHLVRAPRLSPERGGTRPREPGRHYRQLGAGPDPRQRRSLLVFVAPVVDLPLAVGGLATVRHQQPVREPHLRRELFRSGFCG